MLSHKADNNNQVKTRALNCRNEKPLKPLHELLFRQIILNNTEQFKYFTVQYLPQDQQSYRP
jgi:hypothetical protein